jgi:hypothetical protein
MSISAINAAIAAQLGTAGTLVGSTLHYIDGGRIQLIASTVIDPAGNRQTLARLFVGNISVADVSKTMVTDWQAGTLPVVVTEGPAAPVKVAGVAVQVQAPAVTAAFAAASAAAAAAQATPATPASPATP